MNSPAKLREKAERYRVLRSQITDVQTREALSILAAEYEALAERMENDADEDQRPGDDDRKGDGHGAQRQQDNRRQSDGQQPRSDDDSR